MCTSTKVETLAVVKKTDRPPIQRKSSSRSNNDRLGRERPTPAFQGAKFDKSGYCLRHPTCQLVSPQKDDESGKVIYQELKISCPSCQAAKHKKKKTTSLGGGKVRTGHRVHGTPSSVAGGSSRSRSKSGEPSSSGNNGRRSSSRARSKSRSSSRREYNTPFDSKGRCHHHRNVQLAAKKQFGGGWKVLHSVCPKCMEDKFEPALGGGYGCGSGGGDDDDRSVRSGSSRRSTRSGASGCGGVGGDAQGKFDKNGCCVLHTHIQVAKKAVFGRGWKVARTCPACEGSDVNADDYSVKSGRSTRSASSRKSSRSVKSLTSKSGKPGKASKSGRYGALPFDGDGYCCRHPNVQLAKKKTLGGFKIIHSVCPECDLEEGSGGRSSGGSGRKKPSRRKSGTGRMFDDSGSETSSFKSGTKNTGGSSSSSGRRKKRIRVRNLKTEDEEGKHGRYSGYVNEDHQPHGDGVMKYEDGTVYDGVWSDGSKVHGKTKRRS
ncbi:hypothetical protein ACHAXR_005997 [Thalassiosira sp. AJA248-18]